MFYQSYLPLKQHGQRWIGLCPFHSEKTPSFTVFPDNRWYCFGCRHGGDAVQFLRLLYPEWPWTRIFQAAGQSGEHTTLTAQPPARQYVSPRQYEIVQQAVAAFHRCLLEAEGRNARAYLLRRGIPDAVWSHCQLGYVDPRSLAELASVEELRILGLISMRGRIVVPSWEGGRWGWMTARAVFSEQPRYLGLKTPRVPLGRETLGGEVLVVTESTTDYLTARALGYAAYMPGNQETTRADLWRLRKSRIIVPAHADAAGILFFERFKEQVGDQMAIADVAMPEGIKDLNDWYCHSGPVQLEEAYDRHLVPPDAQTHG